MEIDDLSLPELYTLLHERSEEFLNVDIDAEAFHDILVEQHPHYKELVHKRARLSDLLDDIEATITYKGGTLY